MKRFRRLRASENLRSMVRETRISKSDLIYPMFVVEGENIKNPVESMPNVYQYSLDRMDEILNEVEKSGISGILIFGVPKHKDEYATEAYNDKLSVTYYNCRCMPLRIYFSRTLRSCLRRKNSQ